MFAEQKSWEAQMFFMNDFNLGAWREMVCRNRQDFFLSLSNFLGFIYCCMLANFVFPQIGSCYIFLTGLVSAIQPSLALNLHNPPVLLHVARFLDFNVPFYYLLFIFVHPPKNRPSAYSFVNTSLHLPPLCYLWLVRYLYFTLWLYTERTSLCYCGHCIFLKWILGI